MIIIKPDKDKGLSFEIHLRVLIKQYKIPYRKLIKSAIFSKKRDLLSKTLKISNSSFNQCWICLAEILHAF